MDDGERDCRNGGTASVGASVVDALDRVEGAREK